MIHTPTPWFVDGDKVYGSQSMHVTGRERNTATGISSASYSAVVCTVYGQPDLPAPKANLELIAKAVNSHADLLAALKIGLHFMENTKYGRSQAGDLTAVRIAIAKAEKAE